MKAVLAGLGIFVLSFTAGACAVYVLAWLFFRRLPFDGIGLF